MLPLLLLGGGGHCKSVIEAIGTQREIIGILDKPEVVGEVILGIPVIGNDDDIPLYATKAEFVITVGFIKNPSIRIRIYDKVKKAGGTFASIIASTAYVSKYATIGEGTVVMHNAFVNAGANIGVNVIINTFANIEHDAVIGNQSHVSTGAIVNGDCKVGCNVFIGSQAVLSNGIIVGDNIVVSAGSFVRKSIFETGVYVGNPAILRKQGIYG